MSEITPEQEAQAEAVLEAAREQKREARMAEVRRRMAEEQNERDRLAERLGDEHLFDLPESVQDKVFDKAWEDGHASGEHEVEMHYAELAEIAKVAFKAGQDVR